MKGAGKDKAGSKAGRTAKEEKEHETVISTIAKEWNTWKTMAVSFCASSCGRPRGGCDGGTLRWHMEGGCRTGGLK